MNNQKIKLFLVDDDAVFLKSLEIQFLEHADFAIETFATGELCLLSISNKPDVIILDYQLDGIEENIMNGQFYGPKYFVGDAVLLTPEDYCKDKDSKELLWNYSSKCVGSFLV